MIKIALLFLSLQRVTSHEGHIRKAESMDLNVDTSYSNDILFRVFDIFETVISVVRRARGMDTEIEKCLSEDLNEEEILRIQQITENFRQNSRKNAESLVVPVYFHSIQPFPLIAHLTRWQIERQINILNEAYSGSGNTLYPNDCDGNRIDFDSSGGKNAQITFELGGVLRHYKPLLFFFPLMDYPSFKESLHEGDCTALNIYSVYFHQGLGISSNPLNCENQPNLDGVMIDLRTLPKGIIGNQEYDEGDTLVHEVGHWLGLSHTFTGGCNEEGEGISDTPQQTTPSFGCPVGKDSCPFDDGVDPIHNFMDYSDDCCMYEFTTEQIEKMQAVMEHRFNISKTSSD